MSPFFIRCAMPVMILTCATASKERLVWSYMHATAAQTTLTMFATKATAKATKSAISCKDAEIYAYHHHTCG
eukprot:2348532-Amphidinium_carterae.1